MICYIPTMRNARSGLPWYQQPVVVILALVFVAPLGIALLWWQRLWSERTRINAIADNMTLAGLAKTYTVAAPEGGK